MAYASTNIGVNLTRFTQREGYPPKYIVSIIDTHVYLIASRS